MAQSPPHDSSRNMNRFPHRIILISPIFKTGFLTSISQFQGVNRLEYVVAPHQSTDTECVLIPEEFDIMHMIGENKNILMASFPMEDKDDEQ